jgi:hypothetical protein
MFEALRERIPLVEGDVKALLLSDKEIMVEFARWINNAERVEAMELRLQELTQANEWLTDENERLRGILDWNDIKVDA